MKYQKKHFESHPKSSISGKHFKSKTNTKIKYSNRYFLILTCIVLLCFSCINSMIAYFTNKEIKTNMFNIVADYTVQFDANTGTGTMADQTISYNVATALSTNAYTKTGFAFSGWNTEPNGSGTPYNDEEAVTNIAPQNTRNIVLYAQWSTLGGVAQIGNTIYPTLQSAINAVSTNNVNTVITLLANVQENLIIDAGKNITFNFQNFEVTNNSVEALITNNGTIEITNGTLTMTSSNNGAINNQVNAVLKISGGTFQMTNNQGKQVIYNTGGRVEISGNPYISSVSSAGRNERPTVDNYIDEKTNTPGVMIITGGTIVSPNSDALRNRATMTIGEKDGNVSTTSPVIRGHKSGLVALSNVDFYDGIIEGETAAPITDETFINDIETGYSIIHSAETIDNKTYNTAYLDSGIIVNFDPCGGTLGELQRVVDMGDQIGTLPIPTFERNDFVGWFTQPNGGGTQISASTIINGPVTYYAHWIYNYYASVNGNNYYYLQDAIDAVPANNVETTVTLLKNTSEILTIDAGQNIVFDLQNYTISNNGNSPVITNDGTLKITNGTITSSTEQGAINNNATGHLIMTGGTITMTGSKQAIYNVSGTVEISGTAYLSSTSNNRATVQSKDSGTVIITGGTIVSTRSNAIDNSASSILTIGVQDGSIDTTTPTIIGKKFGVTNSATFNFYDGTIKGGNKTINGTAPTIETNSSQVNGTETIDGSTYKTTYLTF